MLTWRSTTWSCFSHHGDAIITGASSWSSRGWCYQGGHQRRSSAAWGTLQRDIPGGTIDDYLPAAPPRHFGFLTRLCLHLVLNGFEFGALATLWACSLME